MATQIYAVQTFTATDGTSCVKGNTYTVTDSAAFVAYQRGQAQPASLQEDVNLSTINQLQYQAGANGVLVSTESGDAVLYNGSVQNVFGSEFLPIPDDYLSSYSESLQAAFDTKKGEVILGEPLKVNGGPSEYYFLKETVSVPWYASLLGRGTQSAIRFNGTSDDVLFRLNLDDSNNWIQAFPSMLFSRVENLFVSSIGGGDVGKDICLFKIGGPIDLRNVQVGRVHQVISQPNLYIDQVRIERLSTYEPRNQTDASYQVDLGYTGDAVIINQCHFYHGTAGTPDPSDDPRPRAIRVKFKANVDISSIIGGDIWVETCKRAVVRNLHHEIGKVTFKDTTGSLKDSVFWMRGTTSGEANISPVNFSTVLSPNHVDVENVTFVYQLSFPGGGYDPTKQNFTFDTSYPAGLYTFRDVSRDIWSEVGSYKTPARLGVTVGYTEFDNYSQYASVSSYMADKAWIISTEQPVLPTSSVGIVTGSSGLLNDSAWQGASGTYVYRAVLLLDKMRFIGLAGSATFSATVTNGGSSPTLALATEFQRQAMIRVYRGASAGNYDKYVDVPVVSALSLFDTGNDIGGYAWNNRTTGDIDSLNTCFPLEYELEPSEYSVASDAYGHVEIRARNNASIPVKGAWRRGDKITVEQGPKNTAFQFRGWIRQTDCTFAATANVLGTDWVESWEQIGTPAASQAEFTNAAQTVNTVFKRRGAFWHDATSGKMLQAMGSAATSVWADADGTTVYTPV